MNNDTEEVQFACEMCGKQFDPTPDAMIEWCMEEMAMPEDDAKDIGLTRDQLENLNEWEMQEMKMSEAHRQALLDGKIVKFGGCICLECQDQMLKDQESE